MNHQEDREQLEARVRREIARREESLAQLRRFEGSRWQLFRAMLVFQAKLAVDGLKDLFLAPLAVLAALLDMKRARAGEEWESFERVMLLGERFERWIALYGVPGREPIDPDDPLDLKRGGILDEGGSDVLLDTIELTAKKLGRELRDRKSSDD
ncbi:MAG: hypothetical protein P8049_03380 [Gemmatimonadota bacterium]|jgi:hypothetical protein